LAGLGVEAALTDWVRMYQDLLVELGTLATDRDLSSDALREQLRVNRRRIASVSTNDVGFAAASLSFRHFCDCKTQERVCPIRARAMPLKCNIAVNVSLLLLCNLRCAGCSKKLKYEKASNSIFNRRDVIRACSQRTAW
jgi:hypothetical protein